MEGTKATLDTIKNKKKRSELAELLAERAKYTRIKKEAEEMERVLTQTITPILETLGIKNITAPDDEGNLKSFIVIHGANSAIDKKMLLTKGVAPEIIAECTRTTEYVTMQVRKIAESGSDS